MKRLLAIVLILVCVIGSATAADSLKNLTIDQLRQMISVINAEIISRPEWKKSEVPAGQWVVGEDIPAGTYSITAASSSLVRVWKKEVNNYKDGGLLFNQVLNSKEPLGKMKLDAGWIFDTSDMVIFAPAASLSF